MTSWPAPVDRSTTPTAAGGPPAFWLRAKVPADVEAPDRLAFDLTSRQLLLLAGAAAVGLAWWRTLTPWATPWVRAVAEVPILAVGLALVAGRRDGMSLDAWLLAAFRYWRSPRRLVADARRPQGPDRRSRPLRLPAANVSDDGTATTASGGSRVAVAASTVNVALRSPREQAALVEGCSRWLNGLPGPVQVVVSTRRADLSEQAVGLARRSRGMPSTALAAAAADHALYLLDLAETREPAQRTVTVVCCGTGSASAQASAERIARHTQSALGDLGAPTVRLDGARLLAALADAVQPYRRRTPAYGAPDGSHSHDRRLGRTDMDQPRGKRLVPEDPAGDDLDAEQPAAPASERHGRRREHS